ADRWVVYETVRRAAYDALAQRPRSETFVMTNALCKNAPREEEAWRHVVELAIRRKVPLIPVVLEAEADELLRRLQSPDRAGRKMTDPALLRTFLTNDELQRPAVAESFDVTRLSAEEAASRIAAHIAAVRPGLKPASELHLMLR